MGFSLFFSFSFPPLVLLPERRQWLPISLGRSRQGNSCWFRTHGFAEVFDGSRPSYFFVFLIMTGSRSLEDVFMADLIREAKKSRPERSQSGHFPFLLLSPIFLHIISLVYGAMDTERRTWGFLCFSFCASHYACLAWTTFNIRLSSCRRLRDLSDLDLGLFSSIFTFYCLSSIVDNWLGLFYSEAYTIQMSAYASIKKKRKKKTEFHRSWSC